MLRNFFLSHTHSHPHTHTHTHAHTHTHTHTHSLSHKHTHTHTHTHAHTHKAWWYCVACQCDQLKTSVIFGKDVLQQNPRCKKEVSAIFLGFFLEFFGIFWFYQHALVFSMCAIPVVFGKDVLQQNPHCKKDVSAVFWDFCGFISTLLFSECVWLQSFLERMSCSRTYGVASVSRIDKIIGLFCRILSLL